MKKTEKMYVSLPVTGKDLNRVKEHAIRVKKVWEMKGYEVVTPFDVVEPIADEDMDEKSYYAYCMGKCVEALLMCDGIILCYGWFESKGCRTECNVAQIYGKKIRVDKNDYEDYQV